MNNFFVCCKKAILSITISSFYLIQYCLGQPAGLEKDIMPSLSSKKIQSLRFTENRGQVTNENGEPASDVLFTVFGNGMKLFIKKNGIDYQFIKSTSVNKTHAVSANGPVLTNESSGMTSSHHVKMVLKNTRSATSVRKEGRGQDLENFYLGHCPQGIVNVPNYQKIIIENIYDNIDWVIYFKNGQPEYDFVLKPGARSEDIVLELSGAEHLSINRKGQLEIATKLGVLYHDKPISYLKNGKLVESNFTLKRNQVGFDVHYDKNQVLTIDPSIIWSTYYGGTGTEYADPACTVGADGSILLVGGTSSTSGIAQLGFQNSLGGRLDAYIVKFNTLGNRLWATYFGGTENDNAIAVATDANNNVFICGDTYSPIGMSFNGMQPEFGGGIRDGFLLKLGPLGQRSWSTYYGGKDIESATSVCLDATGNVYMVGETYSSNFSALTTANGYRQRLNGKQDLFIAKFTNAGIRTWGSYYGGAEIEYSASCFVDKSSNLYVTGSTYSSTAIASAGAFQNTYAGNSDAFVVKFDPALSRVWATYYGGEEYDQVYDCRTDAEGNIWLAGATASENGIATSTAIQPQFGGGCCDIMIIKINSAGIRVWGTYYGGIEHEKAEGIAIDENNNVFVAGYSGTQTGLTSQGFQADFGGGFSDALSLRLSKDGDLVWCSYLGGSNTDFGLDIATDKIGNVFLSGITNSTENIGYLGFKTTFQGGYFDAFLSKIIDGTFPVTLKYFSASLTNQKTVVLKWETTDEVNVESFEIERSRDGRAFEKLGVVSATGSNSRYQFTDFNPTSGANYYRLKIKDNDGQVSYSEWKYIKLSGWRAVILPNPVSSANNALVQLEDVEGDVAVSILDMKGSTLWMTKLYGETFVELPVAGYTSGIYFVRIQNQNTVQMLKLVKQ
jgi:hypothetical protein